MNKPCNENYVCTAMEMIQDCLPELFGYVNLFTLGKKAAWICLKFENFKS